MCNDVGVLVLCFVWMEIVIRVCICVDKYSDSLRVLFCSSFAQCMA